MASPEQGLTSPSGISAVERLPDSFYDAFFSRMAKERKPSPIRTLFPLEKTPGVISLLAGKPNASTFPFTSFSFSARCPSISSPGQEEERQLQLTDTELAQALQYGDTQGYKPLLDWLVELQKTSHGRDMATGGVEGGRVSIGSGSQDLIYKAVDTLLNDGDSVLVESPVYAGVIPIFRLHHCEMIEVETDSNGIKSSSLRQILESWPQGKPKPRVLYTVPYGCNPTGMTASLERRKEVLRLAKEHNFLILEDDPYYYVYYGGLPRPASYFALELQDAREKGEPIGRVLRFDSLSKVLSAGIRIGFASGPEVLLKAIEMHTASANLQTPGLTQVVAYKLLDSWGHAGFKVHSEKVSAFYKHKRDVFEGAMQKHLGGLAEWSRPEAGMFFWFKLLLQGEGADDSAKIVRTKALEKGVLALPGSVFLPDNRATPYVRASFSVPSDEEIDEVLRRLRQVVLDG